MPRKPRSAEPKRKRKPRRLLVIELNDDEWDKLDAMVASRGVRATKADVVREWINREG